MSDLFSQEDNQDNQNYYDQLVGEGKKFLDNQGLAKGKIESDLFIEKLKKENEEMRRELQSRIGLEEIVQKLKPSATTQTELPAQQSLANHAPDLQEDSDSDDIRTVVAQALQAEKKREQEEKNFKTVQDTLKRQHGANLNNFLEYKAKQLNLTTKQMNDMARENPNLLLTALGTQPQRKDNFFSPPASTTSMPSTTYGEKRDWKYYEKLRKANPREYFTASLQKEMHLEAKRQGEDFYN